MDSHLYFWITSVDYSSTNHFPFPKYFFIIQYYFRYDEAKNQEKPKQDRKGVKIHFANKGYGPNDAGYHKGEKGNTIAAAHPYFMECYQPAPDGKPCHGSGSDPAEDYRRLFKSGFPRLPRNRIGEIGNKGKRRGQQYGNDIDLAKPCDAALHYFFAAGAKTGTGRLPKQPNHIKYEETKAIP